MATITEDYVSFEIAKLLKEKGFNESCYTYYDDIDDSINRFDKGYHFNNTSYPWGVPYDISKAKKYVVAPTLQMAMKWLRKEHNIVCNINIESRNFYYYSVFIIKSSIEAQYQLTSQKPYFETYEEACEAAIKYCLEQLI